MDQGSRISLLDNRLANQIAAGEVVERPASVVKELLENSIDAGATRIEVDIERGGARLIRITDNGHGIHKDDLTLALTRHATSKIKSASDLANIQSLGFRGEALASIGSVSRLTLTSRKKDSDLAWQAIAHGRDMAVEILPAAASPGTRLEIADLFFNTPARQKFLRAEKTEFHHIEEVFKCHALANFGIAFVLKHNHKIVKRIPATSESTDGVKRVAAICGQAFSDNAIPFECSHEFVRVWGWLGRASFHRSESDIQYVFVNGRPVKDKTLNHAIRQAYEGLLPAGRMATYVIFLEMDPHHVDVNVHPTKHEVRFSQQRLVHDLLAKSIADEIQTEVFVAGNADLKNNRLEQTENFQFAKEMTPHDDAFGRHNTVEDVAPSYSLSLANDFPGSVSNLKQSNKRSLHLQPVRQAIEQQNFDQAGILLLPVVDAGDNFFVAQVNQQPVAIKAERLIASYLQNLLEEKLTTRKKSLLFPFQLRLVNELLEDFHCHQILDRLGFICQPGIDGQLQVDEIPIWLESIENEQIFKQLPEWLSLAILQHADELVLAEAISKIFIKIPTLLVSRLLSEMLAINPMEDNDRWLRTLDAPLLKSLFP